MKNNSAKKWQSRCFRYTPNGIYYTKPCFQGRRETLPCGTNILAQAGVVARDIFMKLRAKGWGSVMAEYAPGSESKSVLSVGAFCSQVKAVYAGQSRTIDDYIRTYKRLVADIYQIERGVEKYDYATQGRDQWLAQVDKIGVADITQTQVEEWRAKFISGHGDLDLLRAAKTSANTMLRQCKALFSPDRLTQIGVTVPNPFGAIKLYPGADMRLRGGIDAQALAKAAFGELDDECLKAFVLSLSCGLRRNECDKLEWAAFNFELGKISIGPTKYLHVKSEKSIGDVDLDDDTVAFFRGHCAKRKSQFVLESSIAPHLSAGYSHYRCETTFERLGAWLRAHGVRSATPIHSLRKMFGSIVCEEHGIHVASGALRHADIGITSRHYVSKREKVTVSLGALAQSKIAEFPTQPDIAAEG
jgi:integrase